MNFVPDNIYHVYNQGNNHEKLFLVDDHYQYFLTLFTGNVVPFCEVIAWCLMPNHFHFMLSTDERCADLKPQGRLLLDPITNGFRKLLSTYSHEFNTQNFRTGSLFRPKTKAKCLSDQKLILSTTNTLADYYFNCFHYIHNNPVKDGLVKYAGDWKWSSYNYYFGVENQSFCNKALAQKYCSYKQMDFLQFNNDLINYFK